MILPNFLVPGSSYYFSLPLTHCIKTTVNQSNLRYRRKAYGIFEGWCRKQGQDFLSGEDLQGMYYIEKRVYFRGKVYFVILFVFVAKFFQPINSNLLS